VGRGPVKVGARSAPIAIVAWQLHWVTGSDMKECRRRTCTPNRTTCLGCREVGGIMSCHKRRATGRTSVVSLPLGSIDGFALGFPYPEALSFFEAWLRLI
jgi:hypothetical protein